MPPMTFDDLDAASLVTKLDEALNLVSHNFSKKWGHPSKPSRRDKDSGEDSQGPQSGNLQENRQNDSHSSSNSNFSSSFMDSRGFGPTISNGHSRTNTHRQNRSSPEHSRSKSSRRREISLEDAGESSSSSTSSSKGSKRNVFSNIVIVERSAPSSNQEVLNELQSSASASLDNPFDNPNPEYDRNKADNLVNFSSNDSFDTSAFPHPDELPRLVYNLF